MAAKPFLPAKIAISPSAEALKDFEKRDAVMKFQRGIPQG